MNYLLRLLPAYIFLFTLQFCKIEDKQSRKNSSIPVFFFTCFFLFLIVCSSQVVFCQPLSNYIVQIPSAVGLAANKLENNLSQNPAQLLRSRGQKNSISISSIPSYWGIDELSVNSFNLKINLDSNLVIANQVNNLGSDIYNHFSIITGSAYKLDNYTIGASIELDRMSIKNYDNYYYIGINLGGVYNLTPDILLGLTLTNVNRDYFAKEKSNIPQRVIIGGSIKLNKYFTFDIDSQVNILTNSTFSLAAMYEYSQGSGIGIAVNTHPQIVEVRSMFLLWDSLSFNFNLSRRIELGFVTTFNLCYLF